MYVYAPTLQAVAPAVFMVWLWSCVYLSVIVHTQRELSNEDITACCTLNSYPFS
jgi:hypothetical protein